MAFPLPPDHPQVGRVFNRQPLSSRTFADSTSSRKAKCVRSASESLSMSTPSAATNHTCRGARRSQPQIVVVRGRQACALGNRLAFMGSLPRRAPRCTCHRRIPSATPFASPSWLGKRHAAGATLPCRERGGGRRNRGAGRGGAGAQPPRQDGSNRKKKKYRERITMLVIAAGEGGLDGCGRRVGQHRS